MVVTDWERFKVPSQFFIDSINQSKELGFVGMMKLDAKDKND